MVFICKIASFPIALFELKASKFYKKPSFFFHMINTQKEQTGKMASSVPSVFFNN